MLARVRVIARHFAFRRISTAARPADDATRGGGARLLARIYASRSDAEGQAEGARRPRDHQARGEDSGVGLHRSALDDG